MAKKRASEGTVSFEAKLPKHGQGVGREVVEPRVH